MAVEAPGRVNQIGEWLPVLEPGDRPFVKRILDWKLKNAEVFYRLLGPVEWIEHDADKEEGMPAMLGWKVKAEELDG